MARKKALIDAAIDKADQEKGLLLVLTGNGKGKSSSAFGMVARALGYGMNVGVAQFIKGRSDTGEEVFFSQQPGVEWHVLGEGFTWDTQDRERDIRKAEEGWEIARRLLKDPAVHLVVLDERGATRGILTGTEILHAQRHAIGALLSEIQDARSPEELRDARAKLPVFVKALLESGARVESVTRIMTTVSDAILVRMIGLAESELGPPPAAFAFAWCASASRTMTQQLWVLRMPASSGWRVCLPQSLCTSVEPTMTMPLPKLSWAWWTTSPSA